MTLKRFSARRGRPPWRWRPANPPYETHLRPPTAMKVHRGRRSDAAPLLELALRQRKGPSAQTVQLLVDVAADGYRATFVPSAAMWRPSRAESRAVIGRREGNRSACRRFPISAGGDQDVEPGGTGMGLVARPLQIADVQAAHVPRRKSLRRQVHITLARRPRGLADRTLVAVALAYSAAKRLAT